MKCVDTSQVRGVHTVRKEVSKEGTVMHQSRGCIVCIQCV